MFVDGGAGNKIGSLADFKDWLKDQSGSYVYENSKNCAFAQYLRARGFSDPTVTPHFWAEDNPKKYHVIPRGLDRALAEFGTFEDLYAYIK